jgi:DNA-binding NtrC family response regulator
VVALELPPLRARRDEIPAIAEGTLRRLDPARRWTLSLELRRALMAPALTWPGNLRQLDGVIQRARLRALARDRDATELDVEHVDLSETTGPTAAPPIAPPSLPAPPVVAAAPASHSNLARAYSELVAERQAIDERERAILGSALDLHEGVVTRAAQEIGLARTSLISRLHTLGKK